MKRPNLSLLAALLTLTAGSAHAENLVENGIFDRGVEGPVGGESPVDWTTNEAFRLDFDTFTSTSSASSSSPTWVSNLSYPIALQPDIEYRLRFSARVEQGTGLVVAGWGMNHGPWSAHVASYSLDDEWQTFELLGRAPFGALEDSRVIFDYGHAGQTIEIDDVVFEETKNELSNGRFDVNAAGWITEYGTQRAEERVSGGVYSDRVDVAGNAWDKNLSHPVPLQYGATYRLRFKAKKTPLEGQATSFSQITAGFGRNEAPWGDVLVKNFILSDEWKTFEFVGTVPFQNADNSRILFDYGHYAGYVFVDDVVFERIDSMPTDDGEIVLGNQGDGTYLELTTETVHNGYLSGSLNQQPPYTQWITTRPEPHDVHGALLGSDLEVVDTYVLDCNTQEWVNVVGTVFAGQTNFTHDGSRYSGRLSYPNITTNQPQAFGNFVCDRSDQGMLDVIYAGEHTRFPTDGNVTFGYVLRHLP